MKSLRRKRLNDLLKSPRFNGDRSAFLSSSGISKGRLTQLLNPNEPFGDTAARNLCESLGLPDGWFDSGAETAAMTAALYGVDPSAAKVAAKFGVSVQDSAQNQAIASVSLAQAAINNIAGIEQVMAALADYLVQMDDYARDNAADVLRRLTAHPEEHARAAALFATAFQSGKRRAA
jgi:hypothetical protein